MDRWLETARLSFLGLGGAFLVAAWSSALKLVRCFPLLACAPQFPLRPSPSAVFVVNSRWQAADPRLVTFPWPNTNTGTAVLGLLACRLAFFPVSAGDSRRHRYHHSEPGLASHDPRRLWCMVLALSAGALVLVTCVIPARGPVMVALSVVILILQCVPLTSKNAEWRIFLATVAVVASVLGAILLFFMFGNKLIIFRSFGQRG